MKRLHRDWQVIETKATDLRRRLCQRAVPRSPRYAHARRSYWMKDANCSLRHSAGWTYCSVGALSLLNKLPSIHQHGNVEGPKQNTQDRPLPQQLLHWLISRQTSVLQEDGEYEISDEDATDPASSEAPDALHVQTVVVPPSDISGSGTPSLEPTPDELLWAGFNGRCNKVADTCYSFWAGGTLAVRKLPFYI